MIYTVVFFVQKFKVYRFTRQVTNYNLSGLAFTLAMLTISHLLMSKRAVVIWALWAGTNLKQIEQKKEKAILAESLVEASTTGGSTLDGVGDLDLETTDANLESIFLQSFMKTRT